MEIVILHHKIQEEKKMRRLLGILLALSAFFVESEAQLLYRISGNNLKEPSFLLGTYHLAPSSFTDSIPGFKASFDQARQVCGEILEEEMLKPDTVAKMQAAMMLPDDMTIQKMLSGEEMSALNAFTLDLMGVDFSNPLVGAQLGKMTPAALTTQFTLLLYLKNTPGFNVTDGIDYYVQARGAESGKKVLGLETVTDQIKALFTSQSLERQKELMMCMVNNKDYYVNLADELTMAYFTQQLGKIEEVMDMKLNDQCDNTDEETDVLISNRNANWARKMPAIMGEASTFFAVGAGHLGGEKGLIRLLQQEGYMVEPVK